MDKSIDAKEIADKLENVSQINNQKEIAWAVLKHL
jgi:hypothetical protein